jgi:S1-C subfamily serine protease
MKRLSSLFLISLLSGATTLGAYKLFIEGKGNRNSIVTMASNNYAKNVGLSGEAIDFTAAAENTVHTVVHVKNVSVRTVYNPMMQWFYGTNGGQQQEQIGTGSGVIISEDGYIVTNNHVIKDATELEVTLNNNKSDKAK